VWGGAVFFNLKVIYGEDFKGRLRDINEEMIITYNTIKNNVEKLIKELKLYKYDKDFYEEIRSLDRKSNFKKLSDIKRAARFIYLNRTWFNGLYRVNGSGFYNVPFGRYKNPLICDEDNLRLCSKALQNTIIENKDFSSVLEYAKKWDFIYFDPPYDTISETANFTSYDKSGFGRREQEKLFEVYKKLDKRGCFVMLSNHNTNFINELYKDYRKEIVLARRNINSDSSKRGQVEETVILNY
jgi:DNA adenine methylase